MDKITIAREHPVLGFAGEEWSKLRAASASAEPLQVWIGTWQELSAHPWWPREVMKERGAGYSDEFLVIEQEDQVILSGKTERATLYAVYQYAREAWGLNAVHPGAPLTVSEPEAGREPIRRYAPRMERRGFVFETINDPPYLKDMADWFGHQYINEMFFTFFLWDQVGGELASELMKRGIRLTLGGHSLKFFLHKHYEDAPTESAADHPYTAKAQVDFRDVEWRQRLSQDIADYCSTVPNLSRISLWPEDIADRHTDDFLAHYIAFTEQLQRCLHENGLAIEVEHIAYNAGLAWNMLEPAETRPSEEVDTLFAYWGRDYRYGYEESPQESDRRARQALAGWTQGLRQTGRRLTLFEYYSDHYMLTNLFPFLSQRITRDVAYYESCQAYGMVNLVVPYRGPEPYPWKWVHSFNSFIFCRALWTDDLERIRRDYYAAYPQRERAAVQALFEAIEANLAAVTYWNVPLFPNRAVDPEKIDTDPEVKESVLALLTDIAGTMESILERLPELDPRGMPRQYAQHLIHYATKLHERWTGHE